MKKTLAFILAFIMLLGVFASVTAFAENVVLPDSLQFVIAGYRYDAPVESISAEIYGVEFIASETRFHLEDADGTKVEGNLSAGVDYRLVFEMKLIDNVSLENLSEERVGLFVYGKATIGECIGTIYDCIVNATDIRKNGDWDVLEFELPQLNGSVVVSEGRIALSAAGFELGNTYDDVVVTSADEEVDVIYVCVYREDYRDGAFARGYHYTLGVKLLGKNGESIPGLNKEDITLTMSDGQVLAAKTFIYGYEGDVRVSFALPMLGKPYENIESLSFALEGYEVGNTEYSMKTDSEEVSIKSAVLWYDGAEIEDDEPIEAGKEYVLRAMFQLSEDYDIVEPDMTKFTLNGIAASNCRPYTIGKKTGKFVITFRLPALEALGDVDGDGEVTVSDALSGLRVAAKLATPTRGASFDFDGDGEITVADALAILRIAAKLADSL